MKVFNLILAILFFAFAALQVNDDPQDVWYWIIIYSVIGAISAFGAFNKYNMWVLFFAMGAVVYQLFRIGPAFLQWIDDGMPSIVGEMKASSPHVELVREFLGLVICLAVLIFHYVRFSRIRKAAI